MNQGMDKFYEDIRHKNIDEVYTAREVLWVAVRRMAKLNCCPNPEQPCAHDNGSTCACFSQPNSYWRALGQLMQAGEQELGEPKRERPRPWKRADRYTTVLVKALARTTAHFTFFFAVFFLCRWLGYDTNTSAILGGCVFLVATRK